MQRGQQENRERREPQTARGKTYTIKTLLSVLGISRNTLRYYEQIGIISPARHPGSNYRVYTNEDVFRVAQLNMLKNAGFEVADAQVVLERESGAAGFLERLDQENERQVAWHNAVRRAAKTLREIEADVRRGPVPRLAMAQPCLVYHDNCEEGYENHAPDPAQDALIRSMPIATFGSVTEADFFAGDVCIPRWGRIIAERDAPLLPELALASTQPRRVGGCPCVEISYAADADRIPGFDESGRVRSAMREFLEENDLEQDGLAYVSHAIPTGKMFYGRVHLPVRGRGLRARHRLARLCASSVG